MGKPLTRFRQRARLVRLGIVVGLVALICQNLLLRPLLLASPEEETGLLGLVLRFVGSNFALLIATPVLVSASALAIEIPPRRLAAIAQAVILSITLAILGVSGGIGMVADALVWTLWLMAAAVGVLLSGFGYDRIVTFARNRKAASPVLSPQTTSADGVAPSSSAPPSLGGSNESQGSRSG